MKKLYFLLVWLGICAWTAPAFSAQGQWGGFIYLIPKSEAPMPPDKQVSAAKTLKAAAAGFSNEFNPQKNSVETVHFLRGTGYTLNGQPVTEGVPSALIRVESMDRKNVDAFHQTVLETLGKYYKVEYRTAVTRQLNYTDARTLNRLKQNAPKRGNGIAQPNAVVFPLSKTPEWWALPTDARNAYFHQNPALFGKKHMGHNEVGFLYISKIFRKLYHARFAGSRQDFMTYFEFADADQAAFDSLMRGLRDVKVNPEWKYVVEEPIFTGKRVQTVKELF